MKRDASRVIPTALILVIALSAPVQAQTVEPFASLSLGFDSECPFACDSFALVFAGEYTSSNWQSPYLQRVELSSSGRSIIAYLSINYDSEVGLPVLVPFEKRIPFGPLPEGEYQVIYSVGFFGEPTPIPNRNIRDTITVAAPGDLNCDGVTDIRDVVKSINQTFRGAPPPDPLTRGDLTCDSRQDVLDVLQMIKVAFGAGSVCGPCRLTTPPLIITDIPPESLVVDSWSNYGAQIDGDSLRVRFAYGGGCLTHHYGMFMSPSTFEGAVTRIAHIYPVHHDHGDGCEVFVFEWVSVGVEGLERAYRINHPEDNGPIILRVHHFDPAVYVDLPYNLD